MIHELKIWPQFYQPILDGDKTFELRKNDRGFQKGDFLRLREWNPKMADFYSSNNHGYTGREMTVTVTYVLPIQELSTPWAAMSIKPVEEPCQKKNNA